MKRNEPTSERASERTNERTKDRPREKKTEFWIEWNKEQTFDIQSSHLLTKGEPKIKMTKQNSEDLQTL